MVQVLWKVGIRRDACVSVPEDMSRLWARLATRRHMRTGYCPVKEIQNQTSRQKVEWCLPAMVPKMCVLYTRRIESDSQGLDPMIAWWCICTVAEWCFSGRGSLSEAGRCKKHRCRL